MQRQGTCNRCGQCCNVDNGFPVDKMFPDAYRTWRFVDVESKLPQLAVLGLGEDANGTLIKIADYGAFNLPGLKVSWRWVFRNGLCKNLEPFDDPDTYERVCPFLADEKSGRRECALVGTPYEEYFVQLCNDMAPLNLTQEEVDGWFALNPSCSYVYVEE